MKSKITLHNYSNGKTILESKAISNNGDTTGNAIRNMCNLIIKLGLSLVMFGGLILLILSLLQIVTL